jgi:hypothetical protein
MAPRKIEDECFYDRFIQTALDVLKSADAAVPMIRKHDLQSLLDLFPSFPQIGQIKKWIDELKESAKTMQPPEPGCFRRDRLTEPVKVVRQALSERIRLEEELFDYMALLRVAPTQAFAPPKPCSAGDAPPSMPDEKAETTTSSRSIRGSDESLTPSAPGNAIKAPPPKENQPDSASGGAVENKASRPKGRLDEPPQRAIDAYRAVKFAGKKQVDVARDFGVDQGTISRWLRNVAEWIAAGNILPDLDPLPKTITMDPSKLEQGPRRR